MACCVYLLSYWLSVLPHRIQVFVLLITITPAPRIVSNIFWILGEYLLNIVIVNELIKWGNSKGILKYQYKIVK